MIPKLKELFRWRQLILGLAMKDLRVKYRQAIGGFGWMFVMPLVQMAIFTFVFKFLFKIKIEKYPLFLLSGLISWSFLRSSLDSAANSIINNANLIKKTYFPREILPISSIIGNLFSFIISLGVLSVCSLLFRVGLSPGIFWLPLFIFIQILLTTGISLFLASLNTLYRDVQFLMDVLLLLWFYITPIVYPLEMAKNILPKNLFIVYSLNPMLYIISGYQQIFVHGNITDLSIMCNPALVSVLIFILGWFYFYKREDIFVDLV